MISYERNNYRCSKHKKEFLDYCNKCKKNICYECRYEHSDHKSEIKWLNGELFIPKEKIDEKLEQIKKTINKFNNNIKNLINMLNKVNDYINTYYNIISKIKSNYDFNYYNKEYNYDMLFNIKEIYDNNEIIEVLNKINNVDDIEKKFNNVLTIYNKLNQIRLELKVEKEDIGKDIYFLGNYIKTTSEEKHILEELNEKKNVVELFIDNGICKDYKKHFNPKKEGKYNILINLKINLKD